MLGWYRFLNNQVSGTQAAVLFGVKAPTGTTNLVDRFGEIFEAEFQPGSDSWDGPFGAAFSQRLTPALSFHANILATATGTGTQDTNLGNRFLYNGALATGCSAKPQASRTRTTRATLLCMPAMITRGWRPRLRW